MICIRRVSTVTLILLAVLSTVYAGAPLGPIGPRVLPAYPWFGRGGVGADLTVRCVVHNGHLQQVTVLRAFLNLQGRDPVPIDMKNRKSLGYAFYGSIDEALRQWKFREHANGEFKIRFRFRYMVDREREYVVYRYGSLSSSPPRQIDIDAYYTFQLDQ